MSHKIYRLCLLAVVIIAIAGGIFYYLNYVQDKKDITGGTLVHYEGTFWQYQSDFSEQPDTLQQMRKEGSI